LYFVSYVYTCTHLELQMLTFASIVSNTTLANYLFVSIVS